MVKLMKYEFRKTMFSKLILLVVTGLFEIAFLLGVFMNWERGLRIGAVALIFCAFIGIFYIGIESMVSFQRDLNTKQSYMLFLTPTNSYQVLGAKVLENGISILLAGVFFAALTAIDVSIGVLYIGGVQEFLQILDRLMISIQVDWVFTPQAILMPFFGLLASWLMTIMSADLAIVLSATVLAGKKYSGFVSFVLFILLQLFCGKVIDLLPALHSSVAQFWMMIGGIFVLVAIMYIVAGWIMDRKLSV